MTKKDYELIASVLKENSWRTTRKTYESLCWRFMAAFAEHNPKFNRSKFLEACGIE